MKTEKTFCNSDRYIFDWNYCNFKKGFAQIDTTEDASYFGNWVNFKNLELSKTDATKVLTKNQLSHYKKMSFWRGYSYR